jgi:prephenate dehydrogenase
MHLAFLGFGLIAGSIARAVRANPLTSDWSMAAWSPTGDGPRQAVADGVVDVAADAPAAALAGADLVVLAAPATDCLTLIDGLAGPWRAALGKDAVVTDVASTKGSIVARADAAGLRFVGGHPMAGLEAAGYAAARADLFVERPWVVVPGRTAEPADVERVAMLAKACSAQFMAMDANAHDRAVAGISHLPLVVAAALVESVAGRSGDDRQAALVLAAGGWRDTTRVARGDPAMGAAIVATNGPALATRLRDLRGILDDWLAELDRPDGPDESAVRSRLAAARAILEEPL